MNLSRTAFGNTEAALNLADMLTTEANPAYVRKVGRFLSHYAAVTKTLRNIPNDNHRRHLAELLKQDIMASDMQVPEKIKTHAINIATGRLRRTMQSCEPHSHGGLYPVNPTREFDFE